MILLFSRNIHTNTHPGPLPQRHLQHTRPQPDQTYQRPPGTELGVGQGHQSVPRRRGGPLIINLSVPHSSREPPFMTAIDTTRRKNSFTSYSNTMFFPPFSILLLFGLLLCSVQAFSVPFCSFFNSSGGWLFLLLNRACAARRGMAWHFHPNISFLLLVRDATLWNSPWAESEGVAWLIT